MRAISIRRAISGSQIYTSNSPAGPSALTILSDVPKPTAKNHGELVVQVKASSVVRDCLTWPELYNTPPAQLGNDFSGVVVESLDASIGVGEAVYGMKSASHGGAWAEYALVRSEEVHRKPQSMTWEQAAAVPLSAMTAEQALFDHAGLGRGACKRILITGASGGVGLFIIQFAARLGCHVIAATGSKQRDRAFLVSLASVEVVEYSEMCDLDAVDVIIDTKGGDVLKQCWKPIRHDGVIISIDSSSWNFPQEHLEAKLNEGKEQVRTIFFIVEPSRASLERTTDLIELGGTQVLISKIFPFDQVQAACELSDARVPTRGRIVLVPRI